MATNDLMMKIQLLVESGKSTAELDRLNKSLKQLTKELASLEKTQITPLTRDLQAIKQVASSLRTVNFGNFTQSLADIKQAMTGLGAPTVNLDKLRAAYQQLDNQLKSPLSQNLIKGIQDSQKVIGDLRTKQIVPLQNAIRDLRAQKGLDKALGMDTLAAKTRVASAEAAQLRNEIGKLLSKKASQKGILDVVDSGNLKDYRSQLQDLKDTITKNNVDLAKTNENITKQYNEQIATKNRDLALSKSTLDTENNKLKNLKEQLKLESEKETAIKKQIASLSKLTSSDALTKQLELQKQLTEQQAKKVDLKQQISDTESLTKAELARIQALERANIIGNQQTKNLTTLGRLFGQSGGKAREFGDSLMFAFGPQMAGFVAAAGIANALREITTAFFVANKSVENLLRGLNALSGGQGAALFDQLVESSNRLGIPLRQVSQSFLELQASTEGTNFEGQKTQDIFNALANALTVTGADAVQFNRGFRALTQILSKGQLYAEELRQQLGEALPGAVQIFARALGITPKQLFQFMEAGVIEGENLQRTLVLVSKELEKTYKVANEQDFTFTQKAALAQNALNLLFVELGNTGIWRAFGNALLSARDVFVELKDVTAEYASYVQATFKTLSQMADETASDIKRASDSLGEDLFSNVEFSPAGLIRNFKSFFALLGTESRDAMKPVEDAIADIDLSRITVALTATVRAAIESIGILIVSAADSLNQLGPIADVIAQSFVTLGAKIKSIYVEVSNFISLKIEELGAAFTKSKFNVRWTQIFGSAEELNALFKEIEGLDQRYQEAAQSAEERSRKAQENYDQEKTKLESLKNILKSQGAIWAQTTQSAFEGIAQRLLDAFNKLELNQGFLDKLRKAQRDANALQKIYDIDLNYQATLKANSLKISKEQAKLDKEMLDIQQAYQDTIQDISASKYQRWAEQGQITREAAQFLTEAAKSQAAAKAWKAAQEAVAAYNAEADKGAEANKDTLDILKQQADDQLRYAGSKAKAVGDEYRVKRIMEEQLALRQRQQQLIQNFPKILDKAEINSQANPVPEPEKKAVVNDLQSYFDRNKPTISIVPQIDEAGQQQTLEAFRTVKAELDALRQGAIIPVVLNLQDNTQGLFRNAGLTSIPDQNIRITVDDGGKLHQALLDAQGLREAINGLQSGKKFTVEFLDPQGNVERIEEYVRNGKSVQINAKVDPNQAANEGAKAGQTIAQAAQQAVDQKPIEIPIPDASQLRAIADQFSNFDLFSNLPSAKLNTGIQAAMDGAVATVKTGVAQMNQELVKGLTDKGIKLNIEPVTQSDAEGWKRNVQRLTATGPGLEFPIKGFQVPNGTWSDIVSAGNRYLETNRLLLSPAINPDEKIRLLNEIETIKPAIPATIDTDQALRDADRAAQQNPIEVSADAQPLIGDIQAQLEALRKSGATKIKVDFDEKSKKLLITADITQAQGDIAALKTQIETSPAVQKVNFTFDPVPTKVDPADQHVNREYDDPITRLPDAVQYVQRIYTGGSPSGMARGGLVPGGYSNRDSVSALLAPGEFVIPSSVVRALSPSFFYDLIRSRSLKVPKVSARDHISVPHFAAGGLVQSSSQPIVINVGSKPIHLSGSREAANQLAKVLIQTGRAL